MATKPSTSPRLWGTNALYTTGPFIGQPGKVDPGVGVAAEGHRPGAAFPTPAEFKGFTAAFKTSKDKARAHLVAEMRDENDSLKRELAAAKSQMRHAGIGYDRPAEGPWEVET